MVTQNRGKIMQTAKKMTTANQIKIKDKLPSPNFFFKRYSGKDFRFGKAYLTSFVQRERTSSFCSEAFCAS